MWRKSVRGTLRYSALVYTIVLSSFLMHVLLCFVVLFHAHLLHHRIMQFVPKAYQLSLESRPVSRSKVDTVSDPRLEVQRARLKVHVRARLRREATCTGERRGRVPD